MEVQALLPAEPASARRGRVLAAEALRRQRQEQLVDEVSLLVSEVVTNSLLHAGSDIDLRVIVDERFVRVEVHDESLVIPAARRAAGDEMTGRGLGMVEVLASRWGVDRRTDGKVVWFEIGEVAPSRPATPAPRPPQDEPAGAERRPERTVRLLGAPVRLCRALQRHNDALLREYALQAFAGGAAAAVADHLSLMAALHVQLEAELTVGEPVRDLTLAIPTTAPGALAALVAALDNADLLAREGRLLSPPALPELAACRRWLFREIVEQLDGREPASWSSAATVDDADAHGRQDVVDTALLDQLTEGIILADPGNRIAYANPAAERLFGWDPGTLAGRRLTVIVPERLRDAHIAGFTRYLLTNEARLLGTPMRVPARCRDGSERPIELLLSAVRPADGRRLLLGTIRPLEQRAHPVGEAYDLDAIGQLLSVLLTQPGASIAEAAEQLLPALGGWLRAHVGAFWQPHPSGRTLRCVSVWQDATDRAPTFAAITRRQRLAPGVGLPGRVWQSRRPLWISDVVADANFPRLGAALEEGLRSGFAFPVIAEGDVVGVVEFLADAPTGPNPAVLAATAILGYAMGTLRPDRHA